MDEKKKRLREEHRVLGEEPGTPGELIKKIDTLKESIDLLTFVLLHNDEEEEDNLFEDERFDTVIAMTGPNLDAALDRQRRIN